MYAQVEFGYDENRELFVLVNGQRVKGRYRNQNIYDSAGLPDGAVSQIKFWQEDAFPSGFALGTTKNRGRDRSHNEKKIPSAERAFVYGLVARALNADGAVDSLAELAFRRDLTRLWEMSSFAVKVNESDELRIGQTREIPLELSKLTVEGAPSIAIEGQPVCGEPELDLRQGGGMPYVLEPQMSIDVTMEVAPAVTLTFDTHITLATKGFLLKGITS